MLQQCPRRRYYGTSLCPAERQENSSAGTRVHRRGMEQASEFVERTAAKAKNAVNKGVSQVKQGASHAREFVNNEIAGVKAELCDCDRKTE